MMLRRHNALVLAGAILALGLTSSDGYAQAAKRGSGVDPNEGTVQTKAQPKQFPFGFAWVGATINGKSFGSDKPTFTLDENLRGTGYAGCNTFSASMYPLRDQGLAVGPMAVTRRACDKGATDAEKAFLVALRTSQKWDTVAGRLVIKSQAGELVFERAL
jgi:heat shock protein HslJ